MEGDVRGSGHTICHGFVTCWSICFATPAKAHSTYRSARGLTLSSSAEGAQPEQASAALKTNEKEEGENDEYR